MTCILVALETEAILITALPALCCCAGLAGRRVVGIGGEDAAEEAQPEGVEVEAGEKTESEERVSRPLLYVSTGPRTILWAVP